MKDADGNPISIGDRIVADGMKGTVVCDFDNRKFAEGYGRWDMPDIETLGGGNPRSGIMIHTEEAGLVQYDLGTESSLSRLS